MAHAESGILGYETTLNQEASERIKEIGWADIVVGIPSYRNGRTIGEVLEAVAEGIASYLPDKRVVLMNADGGSTDNTVEQVRAVKTSANVRKLCIVYKGKSGKGLAIRSIFEAATRLRAEASMIVEARAPGIRPEWLPALIKPVLTGDDIAFACYDKSAYAASLADNLFYPFLRVFLDTDLREPLCSEFCIKAELGEELAGRDVWETDVAQFGVNIWIAIQALVDGWDISQVPLGFRGDPSGDPGDLLDPRFEHEVGTLFRLLSVHEELWRTGPPHRHLPFSRSRDLDVVPPCRDCIDELLHGMHEGWKTYGGDWQSILSHETFGQVENVLTQGTGEFAFSEDLWAKVVMEYAMSHNRGEGDPDRIGKSLLPLFHGRAAAYVKHTRDFTLAEREAVVQKVVSSFLGLKPSFTRQWSQYDSWLDTDSRFWLGL
ncbi:MAG: hypothetical protein U9R48_01645 [Chloroflexota bacterium]|nr:hypothetical protein [Chloroflexota bacterium]